MPTVRVETNLSANFFPNDFMPLFLIFLAETLGKDKNLMKFVFDTDKNMTIVSSYLVLSTTLLGNFLVVRCLVEWATSSELEKI